MNVEVVGVELSAGTNHRVDVVGMESRIKRIVVKSANDEGMIVGVGRCLSLRFTAKELRKFSLACMLRVDWSHPRLNLFTLLRSSFNPDVG